MLLVAFEPEEESPIVFLRLRKAAAQAGLKVVSVAPVHHPERREDVRLAGALPTRPGARRPRRDQPARRRDRAGRRAARERAPVASPPSRGSPSGPAPGWPGCRAGPVSAGPWRPGLLPEPGARDLPRDPRRRLRGSRSTAWSSAASTRPTCLTRLRPARRWPGCRSWSRWSCGTRRSPSSPTSSSRRRGRGEGRHVRRLGGPRASVRGRAARRRRRMTDLRVLHTLAAEMGVALGLAGRRCGPARAAGVGGSRQRVAPAACRRCRPRRASSGPGEAILATWSWLLDDGRMQDGEPHLAGTRKLPRLHLSAATAAAIGVGARRPGDGRLRDRRGGLDHPSAGRRRPARRRGLAADQRVPARTCASSSGRRTAMSCGSPCTPAATSAREARR